MLKPLLKEPYQAFVLLGIDGKGDEEAKHIVVPVCYGCRLPILSNLDMVNIETEDVALEPIGEADGRKVYLVGPQLRCWHKIPCSPISREGVWMPITNVLKSDQRYDAEKLAT